MSLPILQPGRDLSASDLVRLYLRTELHWTRHLGDETALDSGTAFANAALPRSGEANRMLDAALPPGASPEAALAEADAHFVADGLRCGGWTMNPAAPPERTWPLVERLLSSGWTRTAKDVLRLHAAPARPAGDLPGVTVIPARASYRHARALAEAAGQATPDGGADYAAASMLHLDDAHYDALIALDGGAAVARSGVLAVGDVGRIDEVFVAPARRRRGIGRAMLARTLETCARSLFRHVLTAAAPGDVAMQSLLREAGFRKLGEVVSYRSPATR